MVILEDDVPVYLNDPAVSFLLDGCLVHSIVIPQENSGSCL